MSTSIKLQTVIVAAALCIFAALLPTKVRADEFHYVNILIGDRSADMAGAYTAISDNASGCYYNPAGIAFGQGSNLSASVNGYSYSNKTYKDAMLKTDGSRLDWKQTSSVLLPNYFGATYDSSYGTLGMSYAVPDSVQRRQKQRYFDVLANQAKYPGLYISEYDINMNDVDNLYFFGPSYAIKLRDNFSLGATLYASYRDSSVIRNSILFLNDATGDLQNFEWRNSYIYRTEWGVKPTLGMIWSPTEKVSLGLTASQHYLLKTDHLSSNTINGNLDDADPNSPSVITNRDNMNRDLPAEVKAGIAYFPSPALIVSADLSYHHSSGNFDRESSTLRYTDSTKTFYNPLADEMEPVLNLALGAEYYLNDRYAMRGGLYTDFANTETLRNDGFTANQPEHIDIYGATLSLTRFTRSTSTTLGLGYSFGRGEAQVVEDSTAIQDVEVDNLNAFLSAAYSF